MPLRRREPEAARSALRSAELITTCRVLHLDLFGPDNWVVLRRRWE
jgi:hypothetical protein